MAKVRSEYEIGLKDDTKKAAQDITASFKSIQNAANKVAGGLAAIGVTAAVTAFASFTRAAIDLGDRLKDMATATGASVEQLSFLNYAASQSGSSIEAIGVGTAKLQKNLIDIANGGAKDAAKALATLNLNARDLAGRDIVTQFSLIGTALQGIKNPAERTQIGMALLGKNFRQLAPLLLDANGGLSQLRDRFVEINGVITTGQAQSFDALGDSIGDLRTAATSAAAAFADRSGLTAALTDFFNVLTRKVAPVSEFDELGKKADETRNKILLINEQLRSGTLDPKNRSVFVPNVRLSEAAKKQFQKTVEGLIKELDDLEKKQFEAAKRAADLKFGVLGGGNGSFEDPTGDGTPDAERKKKEAAAAALLKSQSEYVDGLRKQLVLENNVTEVARVRADIAFGGAAKFSDETKKTALALAEQFDSIKDGKDAMEEQAEVQAVLNKYVKERNDLEAKANDEIIARRAAITTSLQTPLEKYIATVKELTTLGFTGEELARGIKKAGDEMADAQNKGLDLIDITKELGLTFTATFEDAIVSGKKFGDVLKSLAQDIAKLLIRKSITEPLFKILTGDGSKTGSGSKGLIDKGLDWVRGLFGNDKGGLYKVGGASSEHAVAFTARNGEYVHVGTAGGGGGGIDVTINDYSGSGVRAREKTTTNGRRQLEISVGELFAGNVTAGRATPLGIAPPMSSR